MADSDAGTGDHLGGESVGVAAAANPDLPDRPNTIIEEKPGRGKCTIRYHYTAKKGDKISWTLESEEGKFYTLFTVMRSDQERVIFLHKSRLIAGNLREQLDIRYQNLNVKKNLYEVKLKKKADFNLDVYFRPESPPT